MNKMTKQPTDYLEESYCPRCKKKTEHAFFYMGDSETPQHRANNAAYHKIHDQFVAKHEKELEAMDEAETKVFQERLETHIQKELAKAKPKVITNYKKRCEVCQMLRWSDEEFPADADPFL